MKVTCIISGRRSIVAHISAGSSNLDITFKRICRQAGFSAVSAVFLVHYISFINSSKFLWYPAICNLIRSNHKLKQTNGRFTHPLITSCVTEKKGARVVCYFSGVSFFYLNKVQCKFDGFINSQQSVSPCRI